MNNASINKALCLVTAPAADDKDPDTAAVGMRDGRT